MRHTDTTEMRQVAEVKCINNGLLTNWADARIISER